MTIWTEIKPFIIKLAVFILLSPLIGYIALQIVEKIEKARKKQGSEKWISLAIVGFLLAVLLGWLQ